MVYYKKQLFFKIADIYYDHTEKPKNKVDVLSFYFVPEKPEKSFNNLRPIAYQHDLSRSGDELFSLIDKKGRKQINKAKTEDGIICFSLLEPGDYNIDAVNEFIDFFNKFAQSKKLPLIGMKDLEQFVNMKNLSIRAAKKDNEILVMHQLDVSNNRAKSQRSCSMFRNSNDPEYKKLVSRANRLLQWEDMVYFKEKGLLIYDVGGWYDGKDKEQLSLNEFKESFGGEKRQEYLYAVPVSFYGYIWVFLRGIKNLAKTIEYKLKRVNFSSIGNKE